MEKELNEYQKHNKKLKKEIEESEDYSIDYPKPWYDSLTRHFKCVECGGYCTYPNFNFTDQDPLRVKCYDCQN